jgi:hypothetical protein
MESVTKGLRRARVKRSAALSLMTMTENWRR